MDCNGVVYLEINIYPTIQLSECRKCCSSHPNDKVLLLTQLLSRKAGQWIQWQNLSWTIKRTYLNQSKSKFIGGHFILNSITTYTTSTIFLWGAHQICSYLMIYQSKDHIHTGIVELSIFPPWRGPFWKFVGKTSLPNLCSLSLFQDMSFLSTGKFSLLRARSYVSLNRLHAIRPQGTIGFPSTVASGSQLSVFPALLLSLSCSSLRLLTYLNVMNATVKQGKNRGRERERERRLHTSYDSGRSYPADNKQISAASSPL